MARQAKADTTEISNVSDETISAFTIEAAGELRLADEARGRYQAILKRAKSAGCSTRSIKKLIMARRRDPEDVLAEMRDDIRYFAIFKMPVTQLDLFGTTGSSPAPLNTKAAAQLGEFEAEEAGYLAGRAGGDISDCPFPPGTETHVIWCAGWRRGQASIAEEMGKNESMAPTRRSKTRAVKEAPSVSH